MTESNHILGPASSAINKEFVEALAAAQLAFQPAELDSVNPHFKRKYASYESCCRAVLGPLTANGFSLPECRTGVLADGRWVAIGVLRHRSGHYTQAMVPLYYGKDHMQDFGAAVTYARRTLLMMLTGAYSGEVDDDGNSLQDAKPQVDIKSLEYESKAKAAIENAKTQAEAKKHLDTVRLRAKDGTVPADVYKRVAVEYARIWESPEEKE